LPELRKDPITGRWVIIATDRAKRPSDFVRQTVPPPTATICPFDYGNEHKSPPEVLAYRSGGGRDQPGWRVRVVPNKFPVLGIEGELNKQGDLMYDKMNGIGAHEVIIETPDHSATFASLPEKQIQEVLWAFKERVCDLKKDRRFRYILLFKNHGDAAGASLEHSHSQLIALPVIPNVVKEEVDFLLRTEGPLHLLRHYPPGGQCRCPHGNRDRSLRRFGAVRTPFPVRDLDFAQAA
jgi:UDPglucose--hexose-1-phosphate uridylyltransferase